MLVGTCPDSPFGSANPDILDSKESKGEFRDKITRYIDISYRKIWCFVQKNEIAIMLTVNMQIVSLLEPIFIKELEGC